MAYQHPELVRTLVLGEPPVMSLLENNHKCSKDVDTIRRNAFEPVQDAIRRGETERTVRLFLDGVINEEGFFYRLLFQIRAMIIDNAKSLGGELASIYQRFTLEDAQKITIPTLLLKGRTNSCPKFLHHLIGILASCIPNSKELVIPDESHNLGRMKKPQVFNASVLEFLSKYS